MRRIRVAFFAEVLIQDFDGATRTMFQIIDRIDDTRFEFLFFCGTPPKDSFRYDVVKIPSFTIPFNKSYKMASMYGMGPSIAARLDAFNPDIIHIATPSPVGYFAMKYGNRLGVPVTTIYHTHFISYVQYYTRCVPVMTPALETVLTIHNRSFYNRCTRVFVPTEVMKSELSSLGFDHQNLVIWKRGIDTDLFNPSKRDTSYLRSITGNESPNILFASRLVWRKNLERLVEIASILKDKSIQHNFIIAGEGTARRELESALPWAHFLGHVDHENLSKLYASADCFVFPSVTETFGNVILEAQACALPCVAASGGGTRSLITHGENGFLCDPSDGREFVEYIIQILSNDTLRGNVSTNALEFTASFSWDKIVASFFDQLEEVSGVLRIFNYSTTAQNIKINYG